jgi:NAD(P)-dependent dehydrogenase (short-subunit alcohol dehydrogenase family)
MVSKSSRTKRYPLAGKVVLITGAGRGLGAATAAAVSARGAKVVIADIDLASAEQVVATMSPGAGLAVACDVTRLESVREAVDKAHEAFGGIDVVVANAGILGRGGTMRRLTPAQVNQVMAVNVGGVVNTVSATIESIISSRGQIVLVSSVFAFLNGAGAIPYAMIKAAIEQLGRGLGVELARHGASAMTAYFSLIETDMIHRGVDANAHVSALLSAMPKFVLKRIHPRTAAAAIADGVERRKRAILVPGRWRPVAALRGIAGPATDMRLARDEGVEYALGRLEDAGRIEVAVARG